MKRSFTALGVAAALLALGACGSSDNGDTTPTTGPTDAPTSETPGTDFAGELDIWVDDTRLTVLADVAASFEEATGVKVNLIEKDFGQIRDDFVTMQPAGEAPDIIVGGHDWLGQLVTNGVVAPIEYSEKHSEFNEAALQAVTYNSVVYGLPYAVENIALLRNDDVTTEEIPATFDELIEQSKALDTRYPVMIQQNEGDGDPYTVYPIQNSFGAVVFETDADGNYTTEVGMGGEAGDEFAEYLRFLGEEGVLNGSNNYDIVLNSFIDGDTGYIVGGPWMISDIRSAGVNVSVHPIPSAGGEPARPFLGVQAFFINATANNPIAANEFVVNYLSTKDVQLALYAVGDRTPALNEAAEEVVSDPLQAGFAAAGEEGFPMPAIPEMAAVWTFWGSTQIGIAEGAGDPVTLWSQMVSNIEGALGQ